MNHEPVDRVLILLLIGIFIFTGVLFAADRWFAQDSQMFQVVASVLTGFTGAFFGRITPASAPRPASPASPATTPEPAKPDQTPQT